MVVTKRDSLNRIEHLLKPANHVGGREPGLCLFFPFGVWSGVYMSIKRHLVLGLGKVEVNVGGGETSVQQLGVAEQLGKAGAVQLIHQLHFFMTL